jgi:hypothetical protein
MNRREFVKTSLAGAAYVPFGMYDQPVVFHSYLQDVRDGWPQFYGVRRV